MSFIIKCSECDNEKAIEDMQSYIKSGINFSIAYDHYDDDNNSVAITCDKCGHEIDFK
jgi:ribosomal protein S27E